MRRAVLIRWHRRVALGAALLLLVQFLSGTLLVFREQLVAASLPSASHGPALPFEEIQTALRASQENAVPRKVEFPTSFRPAYLFHLEDAGGFYQVAIGQDGAEPRRVGWVGDALEFVRALHEDLVFGKTGRAVIGAEAIVLLLLVVTGGWIWWPGRARILHALRLPSSGPLQGRLYAWHRTIGVVVGLLLLPSIVTGFVLVIGAFISWRAPNVPPPATIAVADTDRLALAQSLFPTLAVRDVRYDRASGRIARVVLRGGTGGLRAPVSDVAFDPRTGAVIAIVDHKALGGYDLFASWAYPVHSAQIGGALLRTLLLATGAGGFTLGVLGLSLWWVRRNRAARA